MTHNNIYVKFMIEYDKANVTSSYPSLTEYEVATLLDKAYNALIAQKVTGNNVRRAPFEADIKAISDLQPLVVSETKTIINDDDDVVKNRYHVKLPTDFLYYTGCYLRSLSKVYTADVNSDGKIDNKDIARVLNDIAGESENLSSDVNKDGRIDNADVSKILSAIDSSNSISKVSLPCQIVDFNTA